MRKPSVGRRGLTRQKLSLGETVTSILRLVVLSLLLILVLSKIKQIVPDIHVLGWVALLVAFLLLTLAATRLSSWICRWTKMSESTAEWVAVIILMTMVVLVTYLIWPF